MVFALDRAGIVGADGATHAGAYDIAYIRCVPNMSLLAPADENECRMALTTAFRQDHPVAVRYPRGAGVGTAVQPALAELPWGRGEVRRRGHRVAILAFGTLLYPALEAAGRLDATVANMRFVKPLDTALVAELARTHEGIVTVEEGSLAGGAGARRDGGAACGRAEDAGAGARAAGRVHRARRSGQAAVDARAGRRRESSSPS